MYGPNLTNHGCLLGTSQSGPTNLPLRIASAPWSRRVDKIHALSRARKMWRGTPVVPYLAPPRPPVLTRMDRVCSSPLSTQHTSLLNSCLPGSGANKTCVPDQIISTFDTVNLQLYGERSIPSTVRSHVRIQSLPAAEVPRTRVSVWRSCETRVVVPDSRCSPRWSSHND